MKNTVYLVHYISNPGGLEVLMPVIVSGIKDREIKVFVIRPSEENDLSVYKGLNVKINYGSKNTFIALLKFFLFVLKDRKGIYHLFNTGPFFLFALKLLRIKRIVYSIHGTIYWKTKRQKLLRKFMWQTGISRNIIFTANSQYSSDVFTGTVCDKVKPVILYNPIDILKFNLKGRKDTPDLDKIIYAGRLVAGKNLDKWISTAVYILNNGINVVFEIYGTGPYEQEIRKQIQSAGLTDGIILKGFRKDIEEVYKNSDLLLFLSGYESFGNVAAEAVLCGTPVLTFEIPSMKEIFKDQPQFLVKDNNLYQQEIYKKIKNISELKNLALKTSETFADRFSSVTHLTKLKAIYDGLS